MAISSQANSGVTELLRRAKALVETARQKTIAGQERAEGLPVIGLDPSAQALAWRVQKTDGHFVVSGSKIEKFAARTNFSSEPGLRRLRDIMKRMGITHELERQGIQPGDTVVIGKHGGQHMSM